MRDGKESIAIIKAAMKKQIIPSDMHGYFAICSSHADEN